MSGAIKRYYVNILRSMYNFRIVLISILTVVFLNCCDEPCDGDDPFFEMAGFSFIIKNPLTLESFFYLNPDYDLSEFKIMDQNGIEYDMGGISLFDYNQNVSAQADAAIISPVTRTYFLFFNESETDTLEVIFKGRRSEPCGYEEMEFVKVMYNDKVVYYDLYPQNDNFRFTLFKIP